METKQDVLPLTGLLARAHFLRTAQRPPANRAYRRRHAQRRAKPADSPRPASFLHEPLHKLVHLPFEVLERAGVVEHDIRVLHLLRNGQLGVQAGRRVLPRRIVALHQPLQLQLRRTGTHKRPRQRSAQQQTHNTVEEQDSPVHHNDLRDPLPQPSLDEQRHVEHAHALAMPPAAQHRPEHLPAHGRVHDRIQRRALLVVREDTRAERRAVERAVRAEHPRAERAHDGRERGRARLDDLAREHVGVDDGHVVRAQERGDGGLAGGDPAREADDCVRRWAWLACCCVLWRTAVSVPSILVSTFGGVWWALSVEW